MNDYTIIDPPVGPYSPAAEIRAWIAELEKMRPGITRDDCLAEAKRWLEMQSDAEDAKRRE